MKKRKLNKSICLTAAAVALLASLSVGTIMAYFTTYATAEGGVQMDLGFTETEITEEVVDGKKEVKLTNTGEYDCYVRLMALAGDAHRLAYDEPGEDDMWTPSGDGYYYYNDILSPGETTTQLDVLFELPQAAEGKEPADFNVIIIQENTPVIYGEDGEPTADWGAKADVYQTVVE